MGEMMDKGAYWEMGGTYWYLLHTVVNTQWVAKGNMFRTVHSKGRRVLVAVSTVPFSYLCSYGQKIAQPETVWGAGEMAQQPKVHTPLP